MIHDPAKHFNEGERVLGEIDLAAKQRDARAILLGVAEQLEGVVGGAGAAAENADDQLRIVTGEFGELFRPVVSHLEKHRPPACRTPARERTTWSLTKAGISGSDLPGATFGIEHFEEIAKAFSLGLDPKRAKFASDCWSSSRLLERDA